METSNPPALDDIKTPQVVKFRCYDTIDKRWYNDEWVGGMSIWQLNTRNTRYRFMQFTGLKDSEGREIYDGDIISTSKGIGRVRFNHGMFVVRYQNTSSLKPVCRNVLKPVTVLGNVYEHMELYEQEPPMDS